MAISEQQWLVAFGHNLQFYMRDMSISQRDLAYKANISESSLSRYINGTRMPSAIIVAKFARILNCSADELIDFGARIE